MSHLAQIDMAFRDLDALREALKEMGMTLGGKGKVKFYFSASGGSSADKNLEDCDYTCEIPNSRYGLGFKKQADGSLKLICDEEVLTGLYGRNESARKLMGEKGIKLWERYAVAGARMQARRKGYRMAESRLKDGSLQIKVYIQ
jgi:hypothetical protein